MPPVSQAQRRAMYAAAAGHSTLGIPQKVGAEFVAADKPGKLPKRVHHGMTMKGAEERARPKKAMRKIKEHGYGG